MLQKARTFLGTHVDNSPLVLFRMLFGLLIAAESIGAIFTGWVNETFIEPEFTFTVIGFEWLQPLDGNGMIYYFIVMGIAGILISLGLFYRASSFIFLCMWTTVYIMQKSHYNNHYYLLILLGIVMLLLPAHKSNSLDARWGFTIPSRTCPRISHWVFVLQIVIVYCFASFHKMNPDWIAGKPLDLWFSRKANFWLIGPVLAHEWTPYLIAWGGILYDGSIAFLLLFRKTRNLGFILSILFNLFNSAVFHIGIFPYLMILLCIFFYPPDTIRKLFFKTKSKVYPVQKQLSLLWSTILMAFFGVQLLLPLRHHLFQGQPSWTEEGHRLSWRMMLRAKSGSIQYELQDLENEEAEKVKLRDYLTPNQLRSFKGQPDMIWQLAQHIRKEKAEEGKKVAVYVNADISLNGHPKRSLINPEVDLASVPWEPFNHADWILTYE